MLKQITQYVGKKRQAFNDAVREYGNDLLPGMGDILTYNVGKPLATATTAVAVGGCAVPGFYINSEDANVNNGQEITRIEKRIETLDKKVAKDGIMNAKELKDLETETLVSLEKIKGFERFKAQEYQNAIEGMIGYIKEAIANHRANATYDGKLGGQVALRGSTDNPGKEAFGQRVDNGLAYSMNASQIRNAVYAANGITQADITSQNDKYQEAKKIANELMKELNDKMNGKFVPTTKYGVGDTRALIDDLLAEQFVLKGISKRDKNTWEGTSTNGTDKFQRQKGKHFLDSRRITSEFKGGFKPSYKPQKTVPDSRK